MLKSMKKSVAWICAFSMIISAVTFVNPIIASAQVTDPTPPGQVRTNSGSLTGYLQEQYLYSQSGSTTAKENYYQRQGYSTYDGGPYTYCRIADGGAFFTYRLPIAANTTAPLYLSMTTRGQTKLTVAGNVILNTGNIGITSTSYVAREFALTDPAAWSNGYVEVKVEDADPADTGDNGAHIYWMELGKTSPWQERAKHIEWDTSGVVWQTGYYDGRENEFKGSTADFNVGGDISTLANSGTIKLRWNQTVTPGKKYYLLTGIIGGADTTNNYIDMKDDGTNEIARPASGNHEVRNGWANEKVYDLDVTSQVQSTNNVVKIQMAAGAYLDFCTLVEVTNASTQGSDLRVQFKGNELADDWTKLVNYTMWWNNECLFDPSSGMIASSLPNGLFPGDYNPADFCPTALEMAKFGYTDLAKQATNYRTPSFNMGYDNSSSCIGIMAMCYLIKGDNYTGSYLNDQYTNIKTALDGLCKNCDGDSYGLLKGLNIENSSKGYGIYTNTCLYYALLAAADVAGKTGHAADQTNWNSHATSVMNGINNNLIFKTDTTWAGKPMLQGTFRYSIDDNGNDVSSTGPEAAWWSSGSNSSYYYGFEDPSSLATWRAATNKMLDNQPANFWSDWAAYGHNRGFGTDYGVLSERAGWPLGSMLLSDRIDMAQKNLDHIIYNSTDFNFASDNEGVQETSPWLLVREVSKNDNGITGADVGNGGTVEDMNLVEFIMAITNARIMAGPDDSLPGTDQLKIVPRIPRDWTGVNINSWPVEYRNGSNIGKTNLTYNYNINPTQGSISVSATNSVSGVRMRFGPFNKTSSVSSVTVNGANYTGYTVEDNGDSRWVWVTSDIGTSPINIAVNMSFGSNLLNYSNFDNGTLTGWTPTGSGTWSNSGTSAAVTASGDAWNLCSTTGSNSTVSSDVKLTSGGSAGITFRANDDLSAGYDYYMTSSGVYLSKRPNNQVLASVPVSIKPNRTYALKAVTSGSKIDCYLDGVKIFSTLDSSHTSGEVGLYASGDAATFDNFLAYESGLAADTGTPPPSITVPSNALFSDNFANGTSNWTPYKGTWATTSDGGPVYTNISQDSNRNAWSTAGDTSWTDYDVMANVKRISGQAAILGRVQSSNNGFYQFEITGTTWDCFKNNNGTFTQLATGNYTADNISWYTLKMECQGNNLTFYINGVQVGACTDSTFASGKIGVKANSSSGTGTIEAADVVVAPIGSDVSVTPPSAGTTPPAITVPSNALFSDNFANGTSNWTPYKGTWSTTTDSSTVYTNTSQDSGRNAWSTAGDTSWTDYSVEANVKRVSGQAAILSRVQSSNNGFYQFEITGTTWYCFKNNNGTFTQLATGNYTADNSSWYDLKMVCQGSNLTFYINGVQVGTCTDSTFASGKIGVKAYAETNVGTATMEVANIVVAPIGTVAPPVTPPSSGTTPPSITVPSNALFSDNFANGTSNWTPYKGTWATATDGSTVYTNTTQDSTGNAWSTAGDTSWADYSVEAIVKRAAGQAAILGRVQANNNGFYHFEITGTTWTCYKNNNGTFTQLATGSYTSDNTSWYDLKMVCQGSNLTFYINGAQVGSCTDSTFPSGKIGVKAFMSGGTGTIETADVVVVPLVVTPSAGPDAMPTAPTYSLFFDNFESGAANWTPYKGTWATAIDGSTVYTNTSQDSGRNAWSTAGDTSWTDYSVEANVKRVSGQAAILGRVQASNNGFYQFEITGTTWDCFKNNNGTFTQLAAGSYTSDNTSWYDMKMVCQGSTLTLYINGAQVGSCTDSTFASGKIGVKAFISSGTATVNVDDIVVKPLVLFSDNFENGTSNWTPYKGTWATATDGSTVYTNTSQDSGGNAWSTAGDTSWTDYTVEANVKRISGQAAILGRVQASNNGFYQFEITGTLWTCYKNNNGTFTKLTTGNYTSDNTSWYDMKMVCQGSTLTLYINGVNVGSCTDSTFASGKIGVKAFISSGTATVEADNVTVQPN